MIGPGRNGILLENDDGSYSFDYGGLTYGPTNDAAALGTLLFGLRPDGFDFRTNSEPHEFMREMARTGFELYHYANGSKRTHDGRKNISDDMLTSWLHSAKRLAPDDVSRKEVLEAILTNLGARGTVIPP